MFRRELGVSHDHLERSVPKQLCNGAQVYSGHYEFTGKCGAVAMPRISVNFRLFERRWKSAADPLIASLFQVKGKTGATTDGLSSPPFVFGR